MFIAEGGPCITERSYHVAVCLRFGGLHPLLLVIAGIDTAEVFLKDMWVLDLNARLWTQVHILTANLFKA